MFPEKCFSHRQKKKLIKEANICQSFLKLHVYSKKLFLVETEVAEKVFLLLVTNVCISLTKTYINSNVQGTYTTTEFTKTVPWKKNLNTQTKKTQQEYQHTQNGTFKFNTRKANGYPNFVHGEGFRQRGVQNFHLCIRSNSRSIHCFSYTEWGARMITEITVTKKKRGTLLLSLIGSMDWCFCDGLIYF